MRESELAIGRVQDAFEDYRQTHDYLNDQVTIWVFVEDSHYRDSFKAQWPEFMIFFLPDRTVFKFRGSFLAR